MIDLLFETVKYKIKLLVLEDMFTRPMLRMLSRCWPVLPWLLNLVRVCWWMIGARSVKF